MQQAAEESAVVEMSCLGQPLLLSLIAALSSRASPRLGVLWLSPLFAACSGACPAVPGGGAEPGGLPGAAARGVPGVPRPAAAPAHRRRVLLRPGTFLFLGAIFRANPLVKGALTLLSHWGLR